MYVDVFVRLTVIDVFIVSVYVLEKHTYLYLYIYGVHLFMVILIYMIYSLVALI